MISPPRSKTKCLCMRSEGLFAPPLFFRCLPKVLRSGNSVSPLFIKFRFLSSLVRSAVHLYGDVRTIKDSPSGPLRPKGLYDLPAEIKNEMCL